MADESWRATLHELLSAPGRDGKPQRVVILGVGNDLNADDGAGCAVARAVAASLPAGARWLAVEGGSAPESTTGVVRRFRPDLVLVIDAVRMELAPGEIRWIPWDQVDGFSASSHTLPLTVLAQYVRQDISCRVELLGIQAANLDFDAAMSEPVRAAVVEVAAFLTGEASGCAG